MSRQREWRKKKALEGKCIVCGQPSVVKMFCEKHRVMANARNSKYQKRRYAADPAVREYYLEYNKQWKIKTNL